MRLEILDFILNRLKLSDPRSDNLILKDSPVLVLLIVVCYSLLCNIGPVLMKDRKPLELKLILILYNLLQVVGNFVLGSSVRRYS